MPKIKQTKKIPSRKRTISQIAAALPELANDKDIQEVADELDNAQAIAIFADTEAGRLLLDDVSRQASLIVNELLEMYKKPVLNDLVACISRLDSRLRFISTLKGAKQNEDDLQDLVDEMIKKRM